jgi:hypothetical protein
LGQRQRKEFTPGAKKRNPFAFEQLAKADPEIALRAVNIVDRGSPVAKQCKLTSIPRERAKGTHKRSPIMTRGELRSQ